MRIIGNNPAADNAEITAVASGTLPSGQPVVVNADGTVSVVAASGGDPAFGSSTVFDTGATVGMGIAFDSNANKIVISYVDSDNSSYGTAVVGTVSGTSISFGTPVVFESAATEATAIVFDSNSNKVVIGYTDNGNVSSGTAIVGTVSGTSISFGTPVVYLQGYADRNTAVFDSNSNKVVFNYRVSYEYGQSRVGTVSGTSISFGTAVDFNPAGGNIGSTFSIASVFDTTNNKVVIVYRGIDNDGQGIVGTVSGTSISFGTAVDYTGNVANYNEAVFDPDTGKVIIVYQDATNSSYGTSVIGTVSGTSISFGTPAVFLSAAPGHLSIAYDTAADKAVLFYQDSSVGYYSLGTVSGTSVSFSTRAFFNNGNGASATKSVFDSTSNGVVISYRDGGNSDAGVGRVYNSSPPNLTAENFIGMSSGVVNVESGTQAIGSASVFESAASSYISATFDSSNNKVVVAYNDNGNSYYGTAVVGTVSGTSISFGTPVVFESANSQFISATYDANAAKVVISYADGSNSNHGTAIVGTVSGTGISFGSLAVFESAVSYYMSSAYDSTSQKVVIAYQDGGNSSYGTAVVCTVSGTNISFGTPAVFEAASTSNTSVAYDSNAQKVVISYTDDGNSSYLTAVVGTVSGTNISFGTPVSTGEVSTDLSSVFDISSNKVVITYNTSSTGKAVVGTVSGTGISFGSPVVFDSNNSDNVSATYDVNSTKVVVFYRENSVTGDGTFAVGTVDGSSISFDTPVAFNSTNNTAISSTYDSAAEKIVVAYRNSDNSNYGTSIVVQPAFTTITRAEVASGSNAVIDIGSAISTNQVSLTAGQQYFVQTDGTLGLTAADPSVIAGTAISATEIIVKG